MRCYSKNNKICLKIKFKINTGPTILYNTERCWITLLIC